MDLFRYAVFRFATMLLTLVIVSALVFFIMNLPAGDYLSNQIAELRATGQESGVAKVEFLRRDRLLRAASLPTLVHDEPDEVALSLQRLLWQMKSASTMQVGWWISTVPELPKI